MSGAGHAVPGDTVQAQTDASPTAPQTTTPAEATTETGEVAP